VCVCVRVRVSLCACVCSYLGDEDAVVLQQVVVVVATGQQLPDFGSQWFWDAAPDQRRQTLRPRGQVPVPETRRGHAQVT